MDLPGSVSSSIGIIGSAAVEAGELAAIAAYPWLGLPVIKQIWEAILETFTSAVIKNMQDSSTRVLIPIIDQAQADAANAATAKLQLDLAQASLKTKELALDLADVKQKLADLIRMRQPPS